MAGGSWPAHRHATAAPGAVRNGIARATAAERGASPHAVVLVLGIGGDDPAGRRRFVEDPHLFNVMVTRARRSLAVVTSLPPEDRASSSGLIED